MYSIPFSWLPVSLSQRGREEGEGGREEGRRGRKTETETETTTVTTTTTTTTTTMELQTITTSPDSQLCFPPVHFSRSLLLLTSIHLLVYPTKSENRIPQ